MRTNLQPTASDAICPFFHITRLLFHLLNHTQIFYSHPWLKASLYNKPLLNHFYHLVLEK